MDIVYIRDLKIETVIGIFDWERRIRQTVSLDLEMATDIRKAAASDDIADALDYKAVAKRLIAFVGKMAEVGFLRPQHRELLIVDATLDGLIDKMAAHRPLEATITRMSKADL